MPKTGHLQIIEYLGHTLYICGSSGSDRGKTTESVHCTVTGPCLLMHHRPSALPVCR